MAVAYATIANTGASEKSAKSSPNGSSRRYATDVKSKYTHSGSGILKTRRRRVRERCGATSKYLVSPPETGLVLIPESGDSLPRHTRGRVYEWIVAVFS